MFKKSMLDAWRVFSIATYGSSGGDNVDPHVGIRKDVISTDAQIVVA